MPLGFMHALFYRILIFLSIIYAAALIFSLFTQIEAAVKLITVVVWLLLFPQVFATVKALSLVSTHGAVFGRFSREYAQLLSKRRRSLDSFYLALPYLATAAWAAFFVAMLVWWP
jgi:hypothetical protein